jgi:hypothetical protein
MPPRTKSGRFRKRRGKARKTRKRRSPTRKVKVKRARKYARKQRRVRGKSRTRSAAARKGWSRRRRSVKNYAKTRRRRGRKYYARNPFPIGGRRGKFELIPNMKVIQGAAVKGAGAVASELVKATVYSTLLARFRPMGPTSVAEDTLARLASGAVTGVVAGYLGGARMASDMVEGAYTVALYKLVADVFARATAGKPKLFGFIANPFTAVPVMPIVPGFAPAAVAAPAEAEGQGYLGGVIPEGKVLPLGGMGGVVPEGSIVPIGQDEAELPERFRARF